MRYGLFLLSLLLFILQLQANAESRPWGISAIKAPEAWALSKGEGAKVLIIDSGLDKDHPLLKDNFVEGRNFVNDGSSVDDISDSYLGHGTHATGTIAAITTAEGFSGVAPKAKIYFAKAGNPDYSLFAVEQAIRWGIDKKVDVISLSFGANNAKDGGISKALADAYSAGIVTVAASGNEADNGTNGVDFPANDSHVIGVGSITKELQIDESSQFGPELAVVAPGHLTRSTVPRGTGVDVVSKISGNKFPDVKLFSAKISQLGLGDGMSDEFRETPKINSEIVNIERGDKQEFKEKNVKGKVILVPRNGGQKMSVKFTNAAYNYAAGILYYNETNEPLTGAFILDDPELVVPPVYSISLQDGLNLVTRIKSGEKLSAQILLESSDFATYSGTSMATPHVAGVVALMKAANKDITPAQVKEILMKTATPIEPAAKAGAGLINAEAAVKAVIELKNSKGK